jgi:uncharacterized protein involved in type VI secretion and phage assembly
VITTRRSYVPRAQSTDKRYFGVVEAIVVDVFDPDKEGRVKIQFPWFDEEMITEYCRVCQLYAGNGYGALFVPEVGDEVLVSFVHGDMRLPVILGGLYNGKDKPSSHRLKTQDQKLIRTKAGHEIVFDDHDKQVTLKTAAGLTLELDDNPKKVTVKTASGQSVVLDGSSSAITIEATNVAVKATSVALQSGHIELGNGAAEPVILGTSFATFFAAHVHTTGVPGSPTSPPVVPTLPPNTLSTKAMVG